MSWLGVAAVSSAVSGAMLFLSRWLAARRAARRAVPDPGRIDELQIPEFVQPRSAPPSLQLISSDPGAASIHVLRRRRPATPDPEPPQRPDAA